MDCGRQSCRPVARLQGVHRLELRQPVHLQQRPVRRHPLPVAKAADREGEAQHLRVGPQPSTARLLVLVLDGKPVTTPTPQQ